MHTSEHFDISLLYFRVHDYVRTRRVDAIYASIILLENRETNNIFPELARNIFLSPYLSTINIFQLKCFFLILRTKGEKGSIAINAIHPHRTFPDEEIVAWGGYGFTLRELYRVVDRKAVQETSRKLRGRERETLFPTPPQCPAETIIISAIRGAPSAHARCRVTL